jgi:hypothetical protein
MEVQEGLAIIAIVDYSLIVKDEALTEGVDIAISCLKTSGCSG